jgi:hypothetical protein
MSGPRSRRTALPRARGRWARPLLFLMVVWATFALFCVSAPPARADEPSASPPVSVPSAPPTPSSVPAASPDRTTDERLDAGAPRHADREPCEESPGHHHCGGPEHHGVLGHAPLVGADLAPAPGQAETTPARGAIDAAREPGAARPPDLHELQLLRV